jgi:organic radical activating enzyme
VSGATASTPLPAASIIRSTTSSPGKGIWLQLVEVTGGEPLAQKEAFKLIAQLCDEDYEVLIETGGYVSTEGLDPRAKSFSISSVPRQAKNRETIGQICNAFDGTRMK